MRFEIVFALFTAVAVGMPHGGNQEHKMKMEHPASSSTSMAMSSMTMPMKRSTPTADVTPTSSASMRITKSTDKPMKAEERMMVMMF